MTHDNKTENFTVKFAKFLYEIIIPISSSRDDQPILSKEYLCLLEEGIASGWLILFSFPIDQGMARGARVCMSLQILLCRSMRRLFSISSSLPKFDSSTLVSIHSTYFLLFLLAELSEAQFNPCNGKARLAEACDQDTDCENKGSVCLRGMCQCHPFYVRVTPEKGGGARCSRLPAKIGQDCVSKCREPLFCRNGKCTCVQRGSTSILNGECVFTSRVGDRCSRHYDCTSPFSACVNHQCVCISGTVQQGSKCVAASNCPMGGPPSGTCTRRAQLTQIPNFVEEADSCPFGQFCVTTPDSPVGHCCPVQCPLSTTVDHTYSCVPGGIKGTSTLPRPPSTTPSTFSFGRSPFNSTLLPPSAPLFKQNCPSETHFCHYVAGDTFSQAVCCKRPCNSMAPDSLYLSGDCVPRGQLDAECQRHEQCAAAEGMECVKGTLDNPSQQCVRDCDKASSLSRDTTCLTKTQLGGTCFVQEQCPDNSGCYRGRCLCRCGYRMTALNKCVPVPVPSTTQPPPQQPLVPGLVGPNGQGNDIFSSLLGRFLGRTPSLPLNFQQN
uniref:EB domain-containing protein n=1 Tax=Ditylenchus dipsaci TaxID=166011 RepID=A0A915CXB5_9BILA